MDKIIETINKAKVEISEHNSYPFFYIIQVKDEAKSFDYVIEMSNTLDNNKANNFGENEIDMVYSIEHDKEVDNRLLDYMMCHKDSRPYSQMFVRGYLVELTNDFIDELVNLLSDDYKELKEELIKVRYSDKVTYLDLCTVC